METIRIRRAGYPIRHTFKEFVDRYRSLIPGVGPAHKVDCRASTSKICGTVLGRVDFQLGRTKVFLKVRIEISEDSASSGGCYWIGSTFLFLFSQDAQDLYLEQERDRVLTRKILVLQKAIRGWYWRRRYVRMKKSSVLIQKVWRAYYQKKQYHAVSGFFLLLNYCQ